VEDAENALVIVGPKANALLLLRQSPPIVPEEKPEPRLGFLPEEVTFQSNGKRGPRSARFELPRTTTERIAVFQARLGHHPYAVETSGHVRGTADIKVVGADNAVAGDDKRRTKVSKVVGITAIDRAACNLDHIGRAGRCLPGDPDIDTFPNNAGDRAKSRYKTDRIQKGQAITRVGIHSKLNLLDLVRERRDIAHV
jgi:hypothetical protein